MGLTVWAHNWESGELSNTTLFQPFKMNKNAQLKAIRTSVVVFNDPTYTSLNCKIYSDDYQSGSHSPGALIATSDSRTKANITSSDYAVRETYFTFDEFPLQKNTWYNVVINGVGYSPTSSSYLAWKHAYPDPLITTDYTPGLTTVNKAPFDILPIWSRF